LSIDGAMGILVLFHIHPNCPLVEISEAMDIVEENADEDANIIFGTTTSESIPLDEVKLTIIATGFEDPSDFDIAKPVETAKEQTTISTSKPAVLRKQTQGNLLNSMNSAKVVGGYNNNNNDYLDTPTFLRKQMD
jgi:cell division protein FtsZ